MLKYHTERVKVADMMPNHIYLAGKLEKLMLYVGTNDVGQHVFYIVASVWLTDLFEENPNGGYDHMVTFGNHDAQVAGLKTIVKLLPEQTGDRKAVVRYNGIPHLYGEFLPDEPEYDYRSWFQHSFPDIKLSPVNK